MNKKLIKVIEKALAISFKDVVSAKKKNGKKSAFILLYREVEELTHEEAGKMFKTCHQAESWRQRNSKKIKNKVYYKKSLQKVCKLGF